MMRKITSRERMLLATTAVGSVALLLWTIVVAPSLSSRQDSFAQLRKIDVIWAILNQLPGDARPQEIETPPPLRERVTATARAASIDIQRLDPQGTALSVSLNAVPFATLVGWLDTLTTAGGARVLTTEIGQRSEPGVVSARVLLEDVK